MRENTSGDAVRQGARGIVAMAMIVTMIALAVFATNYVAQQLLQQNREWAEGLASDVEKQSLELATLFRKARAGDGSALAGLQQGSDAVTRDITRLREGSGTHAGYADVIGIGFPLDELDRDWANVRVEIDLLARAQGASPGAMEQVAPDIAEGSTKVAVDARDVQAAFGSVSTLRLFPSPQIEFASGGVVLLGLIVIVASLMRGRRADHPDRR